MVVATTGRHHVENSARSASAHALRMLCSMRRALAPKTVTTMSTAFAAVLTPAFALVLVHCSSGGAGTLAGDGGLQQQDGASACPSNPPTGGTPCSLPSGTTCNVYDTTNCECCSSPSYVCQNGKWLVQSGGGPPTSSFGQCPPELPLEGVACGNPCSGMAPPSCAYTCAQAGVEATANCQGGTWRIEKSRAACELDGGADAAADAAADAPQDG